MTNLNPIHECNAREVEMMVGKAMCAYANLDRVIKSEELFVESGAGTKEQVEIAKAKHASEYEATIRIIEMFVSDSIYAIQAYVVDRAEAEFGIK